LFVSQIHQVQVQRSADLSDLRRERIHALQQVVVCATRRRDDGCNFSSHRLSRRRLFRRRVLDVFLPFLLTNVDSELELGELCVH